MSTLESEARSRPTHISFKCAIHGLAVAPDHRCVLCRRSLPPPPRPWTSWIFQGIFLSIVMATAALYCIQLYCIQ